MSTYVAIINTPGYLPMDDEPPTFEHPWEAWAYLAEERERAEDETEGEDYSDTRETLAVLGTEAHWQHPDQEGHRTWLLEHGLYLDGTGVVYGFTPGYDGTHDLGLAYSVQITEED